MVECNDKSYKKSRSTRIRHFFLAIVFSSLCVFPRTCFAQTDPSLTIHFVDAGYGDCSVIQLPSGKMILVDTGSRSSASAILAYLATLKVEVIDQVILTHPHENHFGGLKEILDRLAVVEVFMNGDDRGEEGFSELIRSLEKKGIIPKVLKRGDTIDHPTDNIQLRILHPDQLKDSVNAGSLVTLLQYRDFSFVFFSDIEEAQQKDVIRQYPEIKRAQGVSVPHHGRSISEEFVQAFVGKIFIASTGPSRWGPANEEQLNRLIGDVYRTDKQGPITLTTDGQRAKVIYGN